VSVRNPSPVGVAFAQLDELRRLQGRLLDVVGFGPQRTPSHAVHQMPGVRVHAYAGSADGPPVLLVPAPIKRAYIFDLAPATSIVRLLLRAGLRVHLVEWTEPDAQQADFGLAEYGDRLLDDCVGAVRSVTGEPDVCLVGHSLGGTLAAIFAALHPERVRSLVLLEAPLHFGRDAGAVAPLVAAAPHARTLRAALDPAPGSFLSLVTALAAPVTVQVERYLDLLSSLPDPSALRTHLQIQRWTLDEFPLPARLFAEVVDLLYREDRLMRGEPVVRGRAAGPDQLTAPLLNVVDPRSRLIPPESVVPFHDAAGSDRKMLLWYEGDRGVALQHVGALVGRNAHHRLWPQIVDWLREPS
jgi:polyhydroxyalkanoate synthase